MTGWAIAAIVLGALVIIFSKPIGTWARGDDDAITDFNERVMPRFTKPRQVLAARVWMVLIGAILIAMGVAALI